LIARPAIRDATVVGVPDAEFSQRVVDFVLLASGVRSAILGEILAWVAEPLANYKVPESLTIARETRRYLRQDRRRRGGLEGMQSPRNGIWEMSAQRGEAHRLIP
jgi:acyl-CoA synthetase (AMP-forming)/AMP-acid ligase II